MKNDRMKTWRRRAQLTVLAALPVFALAPAATRVFGEETVVDGPGTDFVKCTDDAWASYNKCLMSSTFSWEQKLCDLAFQADVVYCGSVYYHRVATGN
jgi:hypothetical protein